MRRAYIADKADLGAVIMPITRVCNAPVVCAYRNAYGDAFAVENDIRFGHEVAVRILGELILKA